MTDSLKDIKREAALDMATDLGTTFDDAFNQIAEFVGDDPISELPHIRVDESGQATSRKPSNILYNIDNSTNLDFAEGVSKVANKAYRLLGTNSSSEDEVGRALQYILAGLYLAKGLCNLATVKLGTEDSALIMILHKSTMKGKSELSEEALWERLLELRKDAPSLNAGRDLPELRKRLEKLKVVRVVGQRNSGWYLAESVTSS